MADSFGVDKFYLVGVSAGGTYAWAAASMLSARVRGVLLLSSAGPRGASLLPSSVSWLISMDKICIAVAAMELTCLCQWI